MNSEAPGFRAASECFAPVRDRWAAHTRANRRPAWDCRLARADPANYPPGVQTHPPILSLAELRGHLHPFCVKHRIRRLDLFGSAARGEAGPRSDVDMLVTLDESAPVSTAELLEMAGEAEELVGAPVDFVLRPSLEKSPNHFAREHILSTAVCVYGS